MTRSTSTENSPLLLQPILYGGREATDQYIGGGLPSVGPGSDSSTSSKGSCCAICGESTPSLARFRTHPTTAAVSGGGGAPTLKNQQRMLHVMACTKASCWNALFADLEGGNVSLGGKGVLSCTLSAAVDVDVDVDVVATAATATNTNASTASATIVSTNDEWGNTGEANKSASETHDDMDSLEAQLAAIEQAEGGFSSSNGSKISTPNPGAASSSQSPPPPMPTPILGEELEQPITPPPDQSWSTTPTTVFPRYELYAVKEPNAPRPNNSNSTAANPNRTSSSRHGKDSAKIQAMLDRYLADETDETIRSALAAAGHTNGRGGGDNDDFCLGGDEEEEEDDEDEDKTPTADKILRDYKERLQRVPRQVIRCGGTPLWSVYVVSYLLHCRPICDLAGGK
jgi:hypothetical protein